ncbi:MAG: hypothetical protein IPJ81_17965 [Chitinophagaceae bacterium]|nr:hypothetical protein [Chitinophagaceae bacterium]
MAYQKNANNIELGGYLTKPTIINTTGHNFDIRDTTEFGTSRFVMDIEGNNVIIAKGTGYDSTVLRQSQEDGETMMQVHYAGGKTNRMFVNPSGAEMDAFDPIDGGVGLFFTPTIAQFSDTRAVPTGLQYVSDYSSTLTNLSLTPKVYVDKKAANINTNTTDVGNIGTGEDDLMTYSIPAGKLANNGDYAEFTMTLSFAANANNKQVKLYYGANNFYASGAQPQNDGTMEITVRLFAPVPPHKK